MRDRINILLASIQYTFRQDTAHWANNWGNILSTCFYTISQILFIEILYSNVREVAGYLRNELLLFMFVGQIGYYLMWTVHTNLKELIVAVNRGDLDYLLVRPVPALFYVTFKKVRLLSLFRDSLPPMIIIGKVINWHQLNLSPTNVIAGAMIALLGIACGHIIHFLASILVFWLGESSSILSLTEDIEYNVGRVIPLEGFNRNFKQFFSTVVPVLLTAGLATSVMLGKSNWFNSLVLATTVTAVALVVRQYAWNKAVKAYTSASS